MIITCVRAVWVATLAAALVGLWPARAGAQEVATSFADLHGRVILGESLKVISREGQLTRGKLLRLTASDLTVNTPAGERTITGIDIAQFKARRADSLMNGALIGAAAAAIPMGMLAYQLDEDCTNCAVGIAVWAGIGAAAGMGIDALIKGDITVMKLASGSNGRLTVAPLVQRDRRGLVCAVRF
jgi:hypothetical protein